MYPKYPRFLRRGGALTQVFVFLVCASGMVALAWLLLLPSLFTSVIQSRTGFPARIDYFYANPFTAEVRMRGLAIMNPVGFNETNCLELHQFTAKADLFSLLGRPVLDMSSIDVARITVVTNANGTTNLDLISRRLVAGSATPSKAGSKPVPVGQPPASSLQFLVRNLDVNVGEVVIKDERPGKTPSQSHALAFQRNYRNVTSAAQLNADLPPAVVAAGKEVSERVSGQLKALLVNATQPIEHQTYTWGDKPKRN